MAGALADILPASCGAFFSEELSGSYNSAQVGNPFFEDAGGVARACICESSGGLQNLFTAVLEPELWKPQSSSENPCLGPRAIEISYRFEEIGENAADRSNEQTAAVFGVARADWETEPLLKDLPRTITGDNTYWGATTSDAYAGKQHIKSPQIPSGAIVRVRLEYREKEVDGDGADQGADPSLAGHLWVFQDGEREELIADDIPDTVFAPYVLVRGCKVTCVDFQRRGFDSMVKSAAKR
jgi:hypothetical protein